MKKFLTLFLSAVLLITSAFALTACNDKEKEDDDTKVQTSVNYASAQTQFDALSSVSLGDSDVAVVDASFLSYFKSHNVNALNAVEQTAISFSRTNYALAVKCDSDVAVYINAALYKLQEDGTLSDIAASFDVDAYLAEIPKPEITFENLPAVSADSEWATVMKTGYLRVGIVYDEGQNSPFLHMSQYGSPDGFEVKVLVAISELFDLKITERSNSDGDKFLYGNGGEITCNSLEQALAKLDGGEIDVVINRMSSEKVGNNADLTATLISDTQVIAVNGAALSFDQLKNKKFTAGKGSVGETIIKTDINDYFFN